MSDGKAWGWLLLLVALATGCARTREPNGPDTPSMVGAGAGASAGHGAAVSHVGDTAAASLEPIGGGLEHGKAMFTVTSEGVNAQLELAECKGSRYYEARIYAGSSCSDSVLNGPVWDGDRGLGLQRLTCLGIHGTSYTIRASGDPKPWTIGDPAASDLLGHAIALLDPDSMQPVACGQIGAGPTREVADAGAPAAVSGDEVRVEVRAQLTGLCLAKQIVRTSTQDCPSPQALVDCSETRCQLSQCLPVCAEYSACLDKLPEVCNPDGPCSMSAECAACTSKLGLCAFNYCRDLLTCAAPVAVDGPCHKLETCCATQGDHAAVCLDIVQQIERLSGDPSCYGAMFDQDFLHSLTKNPECDFGPPPGAQTP